MGANYKGYRVGSLQKGILQLLLQVTDAELPRHGFNSTFSEIFSSARQKRNFSAVVKNLQRKRLVSLKYSNGGLTLRLTEKGTALTQRIMFENNTVIPKQEKWDSYWRIIIFDIPQKQRYQRNMFRSQLKKYGFKRIQASVWVYPFPCETVVTLIRTYFKLEDEVLYMQVQKLEKDDWLKRAFKI